MARDISYQSVGNPIQFARLPDRRPELALPYLPYKPRQDAQYALRLIGYLMLITVAAVITGWLANRPLAGIPSRSLLVVNVVPACLAVYLLVKAIRESQWHLLQLPLACLAVATFYVNLHLPYALQLFVCGAALGGLTWLVTTHWMTLCTTAPFELTTAEHLQTSWSGYAIGAALFPIGLVLLAQWLPPVFIVGTMLTLILYQFCDLAANRGNPQRWTVAWRTLVSWLTYDRHDVQPPGVWCSPAGPWPWRIAATGACTIAIGLLLGAFLAEVASTTESTTFLAWPVLFVLAPVISLGLALAVPLLLSLPVLNAADTCRDTDVTADNWKQLVTQVRQSTDPIERESLYMGRLAHDGSPLLVSRDTFREHAHFLGDSGAGKTSLGLAPLLEQLGSSGDCSIIVIDLKADSMELPATLAATADDVFRRTGRLIPQKHFTNQKGLSTFAFNPLCYPFWQDLELYMRTDILCGALGLTYGADYGEGYYSSANAAVLHQTNKTFPDVNTFRDLADRVGYVASNAKRSELHPEIRKAGVHVKTVLDRLGCFEALNVSPDAGYDNEVVAEALDFTQVFHQPQFHYLHLSSTLAPGSSPEIAGLATYSLLAAATQVERRCQVYLVIDEFQRMVARNIEYMLQLARSMGVGVILANQTMQDLRTATADLIPPIEANCRYRQWFAVSSAEDRKRLIESSGETVDLLKSRSTTEGGKGTTTSVSYQEIVNTRLTVNDILLASDHPRQSIVRISRGDGYAQYGGMPFVVESNYHITQQEYESRKASDWPKGLHGSFVPGTVHQTQTQTAGPAPGPVVTTEVVGASDADIDADPFASFMDGATSSKRRRKQRRKKS